MKNLHFKCSGKFTIENGKLKSDTKFIVEKTRDSILITSEDYSINQINISGSNFSQMIGSMRGGSYIGSCGNFKNISIKSNKISFNGYEFTIKNNILYINDVEFKEDSKNKQQEELKENEYLEYPLERESISNINVSSSAELEIKDLTILNCENLSITIQGSGLFETTFDGYFVKNLILNVQGSGELHINKFQSDCCYCSILGSGDIFLRHSDFNILDLNIVGSGDIRGISTTTNSISKNIVGSGDINGFKE